MSDVGDGAGRERELRDTVRRTLRLIFANMWCNVDIGYFARYDIMNGFFLKARPQKWSADFGVGAIAQKPSYAIESTAWQHR